MLGSLTTKCAIGPEWHRKRSARQIDHARTSGPQRHIQQQLCRVIGRCQNHVRAECLHLRGETHPQIGVGDHVHIHSAALEPHNAVSGGAHHHPACGQIFQVLRLLGCAEGADSRHHAALVPARRQSLHEQAVRFIAPAVRREWPRFIVGGVCSTLAYSMVLAAARLAPVGYVASLRESSVILGAGAGWLFLHERLGRARLGSALVVTAGLVLLIVWQ